MVCNIKSIFVISRGTGYTVRVFFFTSIGQQQTIRLRPSGYGAINKENEDDERTCDGDIGGKGAIPFDRIEAFYRKNLK